MDYFLNAGASANGTVLPVVAERLAASRISVTVFGRLTSISQVAKSAP